MFDNIFLRPRFDGPTPEAPSRLYARFDQAESEHLLFDAIRSDYFDSLPPAIEGVRGWSEYSSKAPIYILRVPCKTFWGWTPRDFVSAFGRSDWLELELDQSGGESTLYYNLFQEGIQVRLSWIHATSARRNAQLNQAFSLSGLESGEADIQTVLDRVTAKVAWVGVYDVGQGNANGLCDANETPLAYFDLGGGVVPNHQTFSGALTDFCYIADPPVILSHWDWDHWSSGARFIDAQKLDWIAPNQVLGGVHGTFAAGLFAAGKLKVWPATLPLLSSGQMIVKKCTGRGRSRNHSGLAMEVVGPNREAPILLAGDARYSAIPSSLKQDYTSLVAPHHGGHMQSPRAPQGNGLAGARVAYSVGRGNTFGHPFSRTFHNHHVAKWPHLAYSPSNWINRDTTNRSLGGLGHIGLSWVSKPKLLGHNCSSSSCAVQLRHT